MMVSDQSSVDLRRCGSAVCQSQRHGTGARRRRMRRRRTQGHYMPAARPSVPHLQRGRASSAHATRDAQPTPSAAWIAWSPSPDNGSLRLQEVHPISYTSTRNANLARAPPSVSLGRNRTACSRRPHPCALHVNREDCRRREGSKTPSPLPPSPSS